MQIAPVKKEQRGPMLLLADVSRGASATRRHRTAHSQNTMKCGSAIRSVAMPTFGIIPIIVVCHVVITAVSWWFCIHRTRPQGDVREQIGIFPIITHADHIDSTHHAAEVNM
jgi:hypothetical protein